jgi:hypothetical protein
MVVKLGSRNVVQQCLNLGLAGRIQVKLMPLRPGTPPMTQPSTVFHVNSHTYA